MNSPVPKAVQAQLKRAEEIRQELAAPAPEATPPADAQPAAQPPSSQEPVAAQPAQEPAPAAPAAPAAEPAAPPENWEHKFRVLQGIHQADVQRSRELVEQNRQLRELLARLQQAQPAPAPAAPAPATFAAKPVTPEEIEEYGAELLDAAARTAQAQYMPIIAQLNEQIQSLEQKLSQRLSGVETVAVGSAKDRFFATLDKDVPYWEKLNTDPGFLSWLDGTDELTGIVRREVFNRASQSFDSARVGKFFSAYKSTLTPLAPAPAGATLAPTVPAAGLVEPAKGQSATPLPNDRPVYTRADIARFYEAVRKGVYRGKDAERKRIEADIFAAGREGRIQA